jgi:hypothetical protein
LARFWLQNRHGFLVDESVPVRVPGGTSDIDLVALHPRRETVQLPDGTPVGPRLIAEAKDEHDFDPLGTDFGKRMRADVVLMGQGSYVPAGTAGVKFVMLRQEHYDRATELFGTASFDRLFVLHALDPKTRADLDPVIAPKRVFVVTVPEVVADLVAWVPQAPAAVRSALHPGR